MYSAKQNMPNFMPEYSSEVPGHDLALALGQVERDALASRRSSAAKKRKNASGWTKMPQAFSPCQRDHVVEADRAVDHERADER